MSPLLRLPPEIRTDIWKYVLGGKTFRAIYHSQCTDLFKFLCPLSEAHNATALLRTCRQIYAEAALMPLLLNNFCVQDGFSTYYALRNLKPHQRKHITSIRIEVLSVEYDRFTLTEFSNRSVSISRLLPNLRKICVFVFGPSTSNDGETVQEIERRVCEKWSPIFQGALVDAKVDQSELTRQSYNGW